MPGDAAVAPGGANMLSVRPQNLSYEVEVEIEAPAGAEAGFLLDNGRPDRDGWATVGLRNGQTIATWNGVANYLPYPENRIFVRLRNSRSTIVAFYSRDGKKLDSIPECDAGGGRPPALLLYAAGGGRGRVQELHLSRARLSRGGIIPPRVK